MGAFLQKLIRGTTILSLIFLILIYQNCGVTDHAFIAEGDSRITFEESSNAQVQEALARNGYKPGPTQMGNFSCRLINQQHDQSGEGYIVNFLNFERENPFEKLSNLRAYVHFYDSSQGINSSSIGYQELIQSSSVSNVAGSYQLVNQRQISLKLSNSITTTINYYVEIRNQRDQIVCATQETRVRPLVPQCSLQIEGDSRIYKGQSLRARINHNLNIQNRSNWQIEPRLSRVIPSTTSGGAATLELQTYSRVGFANDLREVTPTIEGTYRLEYYIFLGSSTSVPTCRTNMISFLRFDDQATPPVYGDTNNQTGSGNTGGGSGSGNGTIDGVRNYECSSQIIERSCTVNATKCTGTKPMQKQEVVVETRVVKFVIPTSAGRDNYSAQDNDIKPQDSKYSYTASAPRAFYSCDPNLLRYVKIRDDATCQLNINEYDPNTCDGSGLNTQGGY